MNNLCPLWYLIDDEAKELLIKFQERTYGLKLHQIEKPLPEVTVDYGEEMKVKPHKPVMVK